MFRLHMPKGLTFEVDEGNCGRFIVADEGKILQALINLLGKAGKLQNAAG